MIAEFDHWRVPQLRFLTGILQLAGSVGLIVGYANRHILLASAGGLVTLMIFGVIVHVRIGDPVYSSVPALLLGALNVYIVFSAH